MRLTQAILIVALLLSCSRKQLEQTVEMRADKPVSFGYKCIWLTVTAGDPKEVADFLGLEKQQSTNWSHGIEEAYTEKIFISPPVDNLIFIVGQTLPGLDTEENIKAATKLANDLSLKFGRADYFVTNRIVELHGWMKSAQGQTKRAYCYIGESGENSIIAGEPTDFEKQFDLANTFSDEAKQPDYFAKEGLTIPNEEFVMRLAGDWGINPTTLDQRTDLNAGFGIIGTRQ